MQYRLATDNNDISLLRLEEIVNTVPKRLRKFSKKEFAKKADPDRWSKKEIIGHLIDSATNNHHRFVRAQFDLHPSITYQQVLWNQAGHYQDMDGKHLIAFWEMYNRHLIELMKRIPEKIRENECRMSDGSTKTISWLFDDYVRHLEHHLEQVFQ